MSNVFYYPTFPHEIRKSLMNSSSCAVAFKTACMFSFSIFSCCLLQLQKNIAKQIKRHGPYNSIIPLMNKFIIE